ncbi:bifunctional enoyl-CoA hydratase/phosphate acetyltransferase [Ostreiculturibacter nitratireducens]|uniref:bifunctional enoyl-CoA hydratase/phosphate acetyltransferase n=1 Tax=Ostreiculturibacter nitratireducens TaxID=3075226 RepID=UPI0031B5E0B4
MRVENRPFDRIRVGDRAKLRRRIAPGDIRTFVGFAADTNHDRVDGEMAASPEFRAAMAEGGFCVSLITTLVATEFPGFGARIGSMALDFMGAPVIGDKVDVEFSVVALDEAARRVSIDCICRKEEGEEAGGVLCRGRLEVIAPEREISRRFGKPAGFGAAEPPDRFDRLEEMALSLGAVETGVVYPIDKPSLRGAMESAAAGLIAPVLIGPEDRIREVAEAAGLDLSAARIVPAPTPEIAAETAARLAAEGEVRVLMKGSLHTSTLLEPVIARHDLRGQRRISHVFVLDVPSYARLLLVSDAAINIRPDLDELRDIVQNTIDLAHVLGTDVPKVALLSAVEDVTERIPSTVMAAAICKMAERGIITGAEVDGPFALDNAVSEQAAKIKGIQSPVAGVADVLIVPDLVSGNILVKDLDYLAGAEAAGVVMGARVPIALTSRADSPRERRASAALACLVAAAGQAGRATQ